MKNPRRYIYPLVVLVVAAILYINSSQESYKTNFRGLPITIEFDNEEVTGMLRVGGQADVIVYSGDNFVFNAIGKVWIRIISVLSYVR